jgi:hypothetical protein
MLETEMSEDKMKVTRENRLQNKARSDYVCSIVILYYSNLLHGLFA